VTDTAETRTAWDGFKAWLDVRFRSPAAIYGLIVYASFITIADDHADSPWELLGASVFPLLVFYIAHVFAHTLTEHGTHGLRHSTREAMRHAAGMLYASLPAALCLVWGGISNASVDDASDWTALATTIVLAVLGYNAYRRRGSRLVVRLVGALSTAVLGVFIIVLETLVH
jgi:drug/metabolite transporter (DMT)-like permease